MYPAARHGSLSRFRALSDAVRDHEAALSNGEVSPRPGDQALYHRLRELESSLPVRGDAPVLAQVGRPQGHRANGRFQRKGH